jgi:hypothetical protein
MIRSAKNVIHLSEIVVGPVALKLAVRFLIKKLATAKRNFLALAAEDPPYDYLR